MRDSRCESWKPTADVNHTLAAPAPIAARRIGPIERARWSIETGERWHAIAMNNKWSQHQVTLNPAATPMMPQREPTRKAATVSGAEIKAQIT
jgi:hypothetical protein